MNCRELVVLAACIAVVSLPSSPFARQNPKQVPKRPGGYPGQLMISPAGAPAAGMQLGDGKLQVATFNLTPREPITENLEQVRAMGASVVEVVKTLLYAQGGEAAANAQGRRLWYDPNTLQLTITDTAENIRTVSDYIRSLNTMGSKTRSQIVPLKHQTAADMQELVNRVTGAQPAGAETATSAAWLQTLGPRPQ